MFGRPKSTVGCSAKGRIRRRRMRRRRRGRGRPRKRWEEEVERDLQVLGVRRMRESWWQIGKKWKGIVRQAKVHSGL